MPAIRDSAVVLKRLDYSETSQIIVFFTREHGKVRAIGKGLKRSTKKRFAVGIDLLEVGELTFTSKHERSETLVTITEWKQTRPLSGLRESLARLYAAQYIADVTSHLTEDWDPHPALFEELLAALARVSEEAEPLPMVVWYQLALLESAGSLPRFDGCVRCGRIEDLTHFSSFEGGMVCRHCEPNQIEKREITPATLHALQHEDNPLSETSQVPPIPTCQSGKEGGRRGTPSEAGAEQPSLSIGPFRVLNYHIAHLIGREPVLAHKLAPRPPRRRKR